METNFYEKERYKRAKERFKQVQGFYIHLLVYLVVNGVGIGLKINQMGGVDHVDISSVFFTPLFWGIGLMAHALSVFLPTIILGRNWEERKIKELMDKQKITKKQWE